MNPKGQTWEGSLDTDAMDGRVSGPFARQNRAKTPACFARAQDNAVEQVQYVVRRLAVLVVRAEALV